MKKSKANWLVTRVEILRLIPSQREVQRILASGWLVPSRTGPYALYDSRDVWRVVARLRRGELPPLLPCEIEMGRRRVKSPKLANRKTKTIRRRTNSPMGTDGSGK